ncbi:hypothetical protein ACEZDB_36430 [Streptacidiphilus sp. N1-3]|uniref:ATP-grasp domain-containing protein n=1 Tax=Streptacidiphilus alkalitolerans TaxID=3342712 RepID=A0ABV6XD02_9ACTN
MTTVRFGSCDAERQWRPEGLAQLPAVRDRHAERLIQGMDELQAVLCGPEDVLLTHHRPDPAFGEVLRAAGFGGRQLQVPGDLAETVEQRLAAHGLPPEAQLTGARAEPYAVVPDTHAAVKQAGLEAELPALDAVRLVNSKTWSTRLDLPGAGRIVTSLDQLREAAQGPCVVKDPYGVSGQGNIVLDSPARLTMVERHLRRQQEQRQDRIELVVQPLFERQNDFAAHLTVGRGGAVVWHGVRQILNNGHSYRGSAAPSPELLSRLDRAGYRETAESVAAAAAAEGYTGPLSVDSMTTTAGELIPVLEVNARLSPALIAQRLGVRLRLVFVPVPAEGHYARLANALDEAGLLATANRPGVLPLAAGTLAPPRGWLFYAVTGAADDTEPEPDLGPVLERLV